jgi:sugar-phosphatase
MNNLEEYDAVIFDMDGILIDSEPFWKAAEIRVFESVGIDFIKIGGEKTVGLRIDEVIDYWYARYPWEGKSKQDIIDEIMLEMINEVKHHGVAMKGVYAALSHFKGKGKKLGLASSSFHSLIDTVLERLDIRTFFDTIKSAEGLSHGKPHPAIYLAAAEALEVDPTKCLVIEDSINGIISAKAAKMQVVAIPDGTHNFNDKIKVADQIEPSLITLINSFKS